MDLSKDSDFKDEKGFCRCYDCETYFNSDVKRPIVKCSQEHFERFNNQKMLDILKDFYSDEAREYGCKHIHNKLIICAFEYSYFNNKKCLNIAFKKAKCPYKGMMLVDIERGAVLNINGFGMF